MHFLSSRARKQPCEILNRLLEEVIHSAPQGLVERVDNAGLLFDGSPVAVLLFDADTGPTLVAAMEVPMPSGRRHAGDLVELLRANMRLAGTGMFFAMLDDTLVLARRLAMAESLRAADRLSSIVELSLFAAERAAILRAREAA